MRVTLEKILVEPLLRPDSGIKVALEEREIVVEILGASLPGTKGDKGDKGDPGPAGFGTENDIEHVLTDEDIAAKRFSFSPLPLDSDLVQVDFLGGTWQRKGIQYRINGGVFSWGGLGLDGFLEAGEIIRLTYFSL
jgi:hypothetical protein